MSTAFFYGNIMKNITEKLQIIGPKKEKGSDIESILRKLPDWFGIEKAILEYNDTANSLPTWFSTDGSKLIGFISIKKHFPYSYEIYVMGILQEHHRKGIGKSLIQCAENYCRNNGGKFLQVKTLSADRESPAYAQTRKFYLSMGFIPLEVFPLLWGEDNPCLLMVKEL